MTNSRAKGKRGELELKDALMELGYECRRGQQYSGKNGDADVVGMYGVHIECKRCEKIEPYKWMQQSESDAREGEIPTVMFRKNREEWLVLMPLKYFCELYDAKMKG